MKRMAGFAILFFILYVIYYDMNIGTLSIVKGEVKPVNAVEVTTQEDKSSAPFQAVEIKPGDTLLSISEDLNQNHKKISIMTIIKDFEKLNPDVQANSLKIGQVYKIPLYE
ncbi:LysM peptidoglycan-binding domain-containing protein [Litchfieldia salsa]|uniref:LysM domain-containing protein n=1 Tax=Litchfieldia salsa TaxID=930152 RepID=A0A1H0VBL8_9BACI|nr:LysM domain-containing protein [Litchfieldia salsa]SDP75635.1 LysM domain-containing protein [Litchfieldia salsa]